MRVFRDMRIFTKDIIYCDAQEIFQKTRKSERVGSARTQMYASKYERASDTDFWKINKHMAT